MKVLYIDIGKCSECGGCTEIAPHIFQYNEIAGFMEAIDMKEYDEKLVFEAMKNCPKKCIHFEEYSTGRQRSERELQSVQGRIG